MSILIVTKQDQDCAIRILDNCGGNWQSISKEIAKYRTEREAQAVQREREAAKGVVNQANILAQIFFDMPELKGLIAALATYNDNRKG